MNRTITRTVSADTAEVAVAMPVLRGIRVMVQAVGMQTQIPAAMSLTHRAGLGVANAERELTIGIHCREILEGTDIGGLEVVFCVHVQSIAGCKNQSTKDPRQCRVLD